MVYSWNMTCLWRNFCPPSLFRKKLGHCNIATTLNKHDISKWCKTCNYTHKVTKDCSAKYRKIWNFDQTDHTRDLKIILSNWSFLFNGKKLWESRNLPIQFVVKMKTHLQIAPFMFFFSRIFIKNDLEGFITKQKILKSHGFMQVRDAWAASEQGKQNSKTGIGWLGPYLKNKIGNFHSKYALCYSDSSRVLIFA